MEYKPDFTKVDLEELQRRVEVVEWQISIAKETPTLRNREQRLKDLKAAIEKKQLKL